LIVYIRIWYYIDAPAGRLGERDLLAPELLVVLGGPIGAYDETDYPFLNDELAAIARRLQTGRPTLGICLGAQLMARALGAKVYPGGTKEIGWSPVVLTPDGQRSPLQHLDAETPVLHWHGDTFDLPDGAVRLAGNDVYSNQAFAWGDCGLALQFHPEVTAAGLEHWFVGHACEISGTPGLEVAQLRADTERYAAHLEQRARRIWTEWLAAIAPTAGAALG